MKFNEDIYNKIQKYIDGELYGDALRIFEAEMAANPALAEEVALHRDMEVFFSETPENDLRKNLQTLGERVQIADVGAEKQEKTKPGSKKYWWWLLPVVVLLGWQIYNSQTTTIDAADALPSEYEEDVESNETEEKKDTTTIMGSPPDTLEKEEEPPIIDDREYATFEPPKSPEENPQLIAANFEPNPSLELLIGNNLRDNELEIELKQKQQNIQLSSSKAATPIRFSLLLRSKEDMSKKSLQWHLFSNDKTAYSNFLSIVSDKVEVRKNGEDLYEVDVQKRVILEEGLYYYLLENVEVEKFYFVEKFEVKSK